MVFPFGQIILDGTEVGGTNLLQGKNVDRIGIQAKPDTSFTLNTENLHVGRSGVFEAEINVTNLQFPSGAKAVIDYHEEG